MLIAVTGASGFAGGRVADVLAARGHDVLGFGRRDIGDVTARGWRDYVRWDLSTGPIAIGCRPDVLVHCAGTVSDWGPSRLFERTNVDGTRAVLSAFAATPRVIHLSTASVYDPRRPKHVVRECAPLPSRYLNAYAASKRRAEEVVRALRPDAVVLRPHAIYGPGDPTLLPRLLASRRGGRLLACGDGRNRVSVTHVDNLVQAVELAAGDGATGVFNVADADTPTLGELLAAVDRALGGRGVVLIPRRAAWCAAVALEGVARAGRRSRAPLLTRYIVSQLATDYTIDIDRARRVLGYRPVRTYTEALPEAVHDALMRQAAPEDTHGRR